MKIVPRIIIELPRNEEITSTEETRMPDDPRRIRKTIRYRNGVIVVLFQDFQDSVFSIQLESTHTPFLVRGNQILKIENKRT